MRLPVLSALDRRPLHRWRIGPRAAARSGRGLILGLTALLLAACSPTPPNQRAGSSRLQLATTVWPITLFTRAVAGDCAQVTPLIPAGGDAHALQARPGELLALGRARVLVLNGLGLESGLQRLVQAADNPELVWIDSSRGISTLRFSTTAEHKDHDHGDSHAQGDRHVQGDRHGHRDGHGRGDGHADDQGAGVINPHIWLDPLRAVQQVETIRDGLVKLDPSCAAGYRRRAAAYTTRLRELHRHLATSLAPLRGQTFVAFHDVAPYFAQRYGLAAAFLVEAPDLDPSPADLQRIQTVVRARGIRALLSDSPRSEQRLAALARDLDLRLSRFDPLETAAGPAAADPDTYFTVMRRNASALRQALAP